MQNRYAGDVGDFGKIGLLRYLSRTGLTVGINWYLIQDESHNADGKHIGYLQDVKFYGCDDELLGKLGCMVYANQRSVQSIQDSELIPNAIYYDTLLKQVGINDPHFRSIWHKNALFSLELADIIFLDPDNGYLPNSVSKKSRKSIKYIFESELFDYYQSGHSIVFYNHRSRITEDAYLDKFKTLLYSESFRDARIVGIKYVRGTIRDYFFIIQPKHYYLVKQAIDQVLYSNWGIHFKELSIT